MKFITLTLLLLSLGLSAHCQHKYDASKLGKMPKYYRDTLESKYSQYLNDNFKIYRQANLNLNRNEEYPILINLKQGGLYQFLVFVDPETTKVEMKLGMTGVGHIITDKFRPIKTGEFYTEFAFVCPRSGQYLLTLYQRTSKKKPLGHFAVLQKQGPTKNGEYRFK